MGFGALACFSEFLIVFSLLRRYHRSWCGPWCVVALFGLPFLDALPETPGIECCSARIDAAFDGSSIGY